MAQRIQPFVIVGVGSHSRHYRFHDYLYLAKSCAKTVYIATWLTCECWPGDQSESTVGSSALTPFHFDGSPPFEAEKNDLFPFFARKEKTTSGSQSVADD